MTTLRQLLDFTQLCTTGVDPEFSVGGAKTSAGQNELLHFSLYEFFQKVDPLNICAAKNDKEKKRVKGVNTIK